MRQNCPAERQVSIDEESTCWSQHGLSLVDASLADSYVLLSFTFLGKGALGAEVGCGVESLLLVSVWPAAGDTLNLHCFSSSVRMNGHDV
jgi:hypothetical protein